MTPQHPDHTPETTTARPRRPWLSAARFAPLALAGTLLFAGCAAAATAADETSTDSTVQLADAEAVEPGATAAEVMAENEAAPGEDSDSTWDEASVIDVALDGDTATATDADGESADGVTVDGDTVTITAAGTYRLSGTLAGQVVVDTADTELVRVILDDASISSDSTAAIAVTAAERVQVVLADGSENTLSDTSAYAEGADVNAALFSAADLIITGDGSLAVHGNGNDGIASKDGLVISGGTITVDAVDDGIRGKDEVVIEGGTVDVTAGGDGLKADNAENADRGYIAIAGGDVTIDAAGDGLDAATDVVVWGGTLDVTAGGGAGASVADDVSAKGLEGSVYVVVDGGSVTVDAAEDAVHTDNTAHVANGTLSLASGDDGMHAEVALTISGGAVNVTESYEGLEAAAITISGGTSTVVASDDGVNAGSSLAISGGETTVDADGDGIDVNGSVSISGGTTVVNGPTEQMNGALDVDSTFDITGGVLLAAGSSGMAMAPSADAAQASVLVTFTQSVAAGTVLEVTADDGTVVATFTTTKAAETLSVSTSALVNGQTYTVSAGGTTLGSAVAGEQVSGMGGGQGGPGGGQPPTR
jgi:Carbohydrate-binding domain-containing protein Cthe_2159